VTRTPVVALVVASLLWGLAVSATKYALRGFGPLTLLAITLVAATLVLWIAVVLRGKSRPPRLSRALLLGLFEPGLAYLGDMLGLARTSAANGATLSGLESAFVVILAAVFLRERVSGRLVVAVVLALAGLVTIQDAGSFGRPGLGDLFILGGVLSAAAYTIVARGLGDDSDPLTVTAYQFTAATVLISPAAAAVWISHTEPIPEHVAGRFWLVALLLGLLGYAASFLLYNYAITRVDAGPASVILNLIPVFGLAGAVVALGDPLTTPRLLGAALIGTSVAICAATEFGGSRAAASAGISVADRGCSRTRPPPGSEQTWCPSPNGCAGQSPTQDRRVDPPTHSRADAGRSAVCARRPTAMDSVSSRRPLEKSGSPACQSTGTPNNS
jgi:O-acetylserine/cysteine efflux transporter